MLGLCVALFFALGGLALLLPLLLLLAAAAVGAVGAVVVSPLYVCVASCCFCQGIALESILVYGEGIEWH